MEDPLTLKKAQRAVREFAKKNGWKDEPDFHKFDHIHEELIEMSKHLRYRTVEECKSIIKDKRDIFVDGLGDTLFALCRLANQLDLDLEEAFSLVHTRIKRKYDDKPEHKQG